jgi:mono/diheme cytochrome c family protein
MDRRGTVPVVFTVALVLIAAAALFGWLRSEGVGVAIGPQATLEHVAGHAETDEDRAWLEPAVEIWEARCAGCHAELGYLSDVAAADGGRDYLIDLMLYGIDGEVTIEGETVALRHRPFADTFDDEEHAALLNFMVTSWGNEEALPGDFDLYAPEEIAEQRGRDLTQEEVVDLRPAP